MTGMPRAAASRIMPAITTQHRIASLCLAIGIHLLDRIVKYLYFERRGVLRPRKPPNLYLYMGWTTNGRLTGVTAKN